MKHIEALLICDGSSDAALEHPLRWLLSQAGYRGTLSIQTADLSRIKSQGKRLTDRIEAACARYEPNVLFIHRDAEKETFQVRMAEINHAVKQVGRTEHNSIPIIPVRMLEAWLLFDETAIRRAAGNPNGRDKIDLPRLARIESEPDPKQLLCDILSKASGLTGRKLKKFKPLSKRHLVAEEITSFAPLLKLEPFSRLQDAVKLYLQTAR
jgi:hypothetical protein